MLATFLVPLLTISHVDTTDDEDEEEQKFNHPVPQYRDVPIHDTMSEKDKEDQRKRRKSFELKLRSGGASPTATQTYHAFQDVPGDFDVANLNLQLDEDHLSDAKPMRSPNTAGRKLHLLEKMNASWKQMISSQQTQIQKAKKENCMQEQNISDKRKRMR